MSRRDWEIAACGLIQNRRKELKMEDRIGFGMKNNGIIIAVKVRGKTGKHTTSERAKGVCWPPI